MKSSTLGENGENGPVVPRLSLGAWPLGGGMGRVDEPVAIATVRAAIDNGTVTTEIAASLSQK